MIVMQKNNTFSFILLLICFSANISFAQWVVSPISKASIIISTENKAKSARLEADTTLQLPFWDDFSGATKGQPNPKLWQNAGVTVSNSGIVGHPTVNVATFDGTNAKGMPYNFKDEFARGETDTLTSKTIDLSKYAPKDAIYLSFYWQADKLSEKPDDSDSLRLQFYTNGGIWKTVWVKTGIDSTKTFNQELIAITSQNLYLHANFKFRFQAFGRQSGSFDRWHIDYVYMNKNRNPTDYFIIDLAARSPLPSLLKKHWSMPLSHFKKNPNSFLVDNINTELINLYNNNNPVNKPIFFDITNTLTGAKFYSYQNNSGYSVDGASKGNLTIQPFTIPLKNKEWAGINSINEKAILKYRFYAETTDYEGKDNNSPLKAVNLRLNDSISATMALANYYAYDDGSAEYAAGIKGKYSKVLVRYVTAEPANIKGIQIGFVPIAKDLSGQYAQVLIYGNKNKMPTTPLYQASVGIAYKDSLITHLIDTKKFAIAVTDTFYVGYTQLTDDIVALGLDLNTPQFANNIVYNIGTGWLNNTEVKGSLQIRPMMDTYMPPTATEKPLQAGSLIIMPNPSTGKVQWNDATYETLQLYDMAGGLIQQETIKNRTEADFTKIQRGIYLLRFQGIDKEVVKKLVLN
jgi:Secretion system C-terminal sorting domain